MKRSSKSRRGMTTAARNPFETAEVYRQAAPLDVAVPFLGQALAGHARVFGVRARTPQLWPDTWLHLGLDHA